MQSSAVRGPGTTTATDQQLTNLPLIVGIAHGGRPRLAPVQQWCRGPPLLPQLVQDLPQGHAQCKGLGLDFLCCFGLAKHKQLNQRQETEY